MAEIVLKVEGVSKQYRLGVVGSGTLSHDFKKFMYKIRGKKDPFLAEGGENDRAKASNSDYVWALRDINFEVEKGEVLGIIGKNGAGKSTLLKLLSQITAPSTGEIKVKGRIASLLEVGTGFHPELTGRENIFLNGALLGMNKAEIKSKLEEIVDFSGVGRYIDTPVKRYSSGMYVRLAFAVAAHLDPEILIVDEVLAVGDAEFQRKCLGKMKDVSGDGKTVLFVSHNMSAVKQLCTRGIFLEYGEVRKIDSVDNIVKDYLTGGIEVSEFGDIPADFPRNSYHKNFLKIQNIKLFDESGSVSARFMIQQTIKVTAKFDVMKEIEQAVIIVSFSNTMADMISYSANNYSESKSYINLKEGQHEMEFDIDQQLLPGEYQVNVSVLSPDGYPYEGILNYGKFIIENFGSSGEEYPWSRNIGFVHFPSKFKLT
jgi:lipopolysaccharide transport system ATP-binding protein